MTICMNTSFISIWSNMVGFKGSKKGLPLHITNQTPDNHFIIHPFLEDIDLTFL